MSNAISLAKELQSMKAIDVIRNERVRNQFISVYNSIGKKEANKCTKGRQFISTNSYVTSRTFVSVPVHLSSMPL